MKLREELDAACNGPRGWVSAKFVSAAYVLMDKADGIIAEREETIRQLRAQLDEYEQAPTVARVIFENHAREVCNAIPREHLPPVGTELIARPTRKGE